MTSKSILNRHSVNALFQDCLFKDGSINFDNAVIIDGFSTSFGFDREQLRKNAEAIHDQIDGLKEEFHSGWSSLYAWKDENNRVWGSMDDVQELVCLGLAIKRIEYMLPRTAWHSLPAGLPYIKVLDRPSSEPPTIRGDSDAPPSTEPAVDMVYLRDVKDVVDSWVGHGELSSTLGHELKAELAHKVVSIKNTDDTKRADSAENELRRLGHGQEPIFVFGDDGKPKFTSIVGDMSWDTKDNRKKTFEFIADAIERINEEIPTKSGDTTAPALELDVATDLIKQCLVVLVTAKEHIDMYNELNGLITDLQEWVDGHKS